MFISKKRLDEISNELQSLRRQLNELYKLRIIHYQTWNPRHENWEYEGPEKYKCTIKPAWEPREISVNDAIQVILDHFHLQLSEVPEVPKKVVLRKPNVTGETS